MRSCFIFIFIFFNGDVSKSGEGFEGGMGRRVSGVFGGFSGNGRGGGGGGGAGGFEGGLRRGRVVVVGDGEGGVKPFFDAAFVLELFLGFVATDEFPGVGVVPPGEADFGGGALGLGLELREELRRRKEWELGF